jgi:hypothetical protein
MGNKWMLFIAMGFVAGAIFGGMLNLNDAAKAQAQEACGICQSNLNTMVSNFNTISSQCSQAKGYANTNLSYIISMNRTVR